MTRRTRLSRDWARPPAAPRRALVLAALSLTTWAATWAVSDQTVESAVLLALSIGGAGAAAYLAVLRPTVAFGIIFLLASVSRFTIDLPFGTMRMEQPAIAFAVLALIIGRRAPSLQLRRPRSSELAILGLLCGYVAVLAVSSLLVAPQPVASLRIVAWTAISLVGGVVAYVLVRSEPVRAEGWYRGSALLMAGGGMIVAAWYMVQGPGDIPGLSSGLLPWRKVYAFAWEPNLFASFLAAMAPFALERLRQRRTLQDALVAAVIVFAIGLGVTRGAYLGLVAGLVIYVIVLLRRRMIGALLRPLAVAALAAVGGVFLSAPILVTPPTYVLLPGGPISSAAPGAAGPIASGAGPTLVPVPLPEWPDTIGYRLERVAPALEDLATSPWIGLGAASFGQRHATSSQAGVLEPDYNAILAVALPYEAGVVGTLSFTLAVALLLLALVRASRTGWATGPAAAYLAAIVALLVAYQSTNALDFGLNWLLGGAALALAARARDPEAPGKVPSAEFP